MWSDDCNVWLTRDPNKSKVVLLLRRCWVEWFEAIAKWTHEESSRNNPLVTFDGMEGKVRILGGVERRKMLQNAP